MNKNFHNSNTNDQMLIKKKNDGNILCRRTRPPSLIHDDSIFPLPPPPEKKNLWIVFLVKKGSVAPSTAKFVSLTQSKGEKGSVVDGDGFRRRGTVGPTKE